MFRSWGLWHHIPRVWHVTEKGQRVAHDAWSGAEPGEGQAEVASRHRQEEEPPEQDEAGPVGRDQLEQPKVEQSSPCPKRGQDQKPGSWQGKEMLALQRALGRQGLASGHLRRQRVIQC